MRSIAVPRGLTIVSTGWRITAIDCSLPLFAYSREKRLRNIERYQLSA